MISEKTGSTEAKCTWAKKHEQSKRYYIVNFQVSFTDEIEHKFDIFPSRLSFLTFKDCLSNSIWRAWIYSRFVNVSLLVIV